MFNHNFNNIFDIFVFDEFFVVCVHLLEEIDAAYILF